MELRSSDSLIAGTNAGWFNEHYQWQSVIKEPDWSDKELPFKVYEISVTVAWKESEKEKKYTISTIGLVSST